jgi:hypothetical protein
MRVSLIAASALALISACLACGSGALDRKRLYAAVDDLAAVAAESRMMLREAQRGLPGAYVEGQRADLAKRAREALAEIDRGVDNPRLERVRRDAASLGFRLILGVETAHDSDALDAFARRLAALAAEVTP